MEQTIMMWITVLGFFVMLMKAFSNNLEEKVSIPIKIVLENLSFQVGKLADAINNIKAEQAIFRERTAKNEQAILALNTRVGDIEDRIHDIEVKPDE